MVGWRNYPANDAQCRQHANMPLVEHEPTQTHFLVPRLIVPADATSAAAALYQFDTTQSPIPAGSALDLHLQQVIEAINERRAYIANPASGIQRYYHRLGRVYTDDEWAAGWAPVALERGDWTHSKNLIDWLRDLIWQADSDFCIGKWLGGHLVASPYGDGDFRMPFTTETEMLDEAINQAEDSPALAALAPAGSGKYITIPARIATTTTPARNDRRFSDFDGFIPMCREHIDSLFAVLNTLNGYAFQRLPTSTEYAGTATVEIDNATAGYPVYQQANTQANANLVQGASTGSLPAAHRRGIWFEGSRYDPPNPPVPYIKAGSDIFLSVSPCDDNWTCVTDTHWVAGGGPNYVNQTNRALCAPSFFETVVAMAESKFRFEEPLGMTADITDTCVSLYRQLAADQFAYKWPA